MGIRTLIRRTAPTRPSPVPAFAADASTARIPGSSPVAEPLGRRAEALRRALAPRPRTRRAHLGPRFGLPVSGRALTWRLWAGWGRDWLRRPLRGGQREPVRPQARPPA
ncbi:hypothetical protein ACKI1I_09770 [Streptomyces turgidiscabies]|uniref:hypothetical protein n=1 Tax=Streptomyces TaxID=1883 RepID=UPI0005C8E290|nr:MULTISPECIES: hypothetical protein [Streptomyces]MDX3497384.1 hypothetical protein [Streptomyces turgidiscabies]GAQ72325.1 hypothetical protein T45_04073 [Streptomyces turgidiscabies]